MKRWYEILANVSTAFYKRGRFGCYAVKKATVGPTFRLNCNELIQTRTDERCTLA